MKKVKILTEMITLGQFLKYVGEIRSGAEAKSFLSTAKVTVNDVLENRRGRKLYSGFTVSVNQNVYLIENG